MSAFEELGVMPEIIRALEDMGWTLPTPIQAEAVPLILGGGDVLGAAETGSGKTGAFGLPVLQTVHESLGHPGSGSGASKVSAADKIHKSTGSASGGPASVTLSDDDRSPVVSVSRGGLHCECRSERAWGGVRATVGLRAGCYYFELTCTDSGIARVGWSTASASLELGTDKNGFGFGGTGKKSWNRQFDSYGQPYSRGDTLGVCLDADNGEIYYLKNGVDFGLAFTIPSVLKGKALYPAIALKNAGVDVNFGSSKFRFPLPDGYAGVASAQSSHRVLSASMDGPQGGGGPAPGASPLAVILEPARDLAEQTFNCIRDMSRFMPAPHVRTALFVGGVDARDQIRALKEGVHVAVGTPGKMWDLMESRKMNVSKVRFFVLDEADRLLETGNYDVIMKMFNKMPKGGSGVQRLQTLMFSATLHSPEIKGLAEKIAAFPTWVDLKGKDSVPETVHHLVVSVDPGSDKSWVGARPAVPTDGVHARDHVAPDDPSPESRSEAVKRLKAQTLVRVIDALKMDQCLIFMRTNLDCDNLERYLTELGGGRRFGGKMEKGKENPYSCVVLAGMRSMEERRRNLEHFKEGDARFLICTDVAARGIDIKELPFVVNLTLPDVPENYIHRVGRVGRADNIGLAVSIVSAAKEKVWFHKCKEKGRGCTNTRLVEKGGCTIWYDEPSLLKEVENRLGQSIERLGPDLKLKGQLASMKFGAGRDTAAQASSQHFDALRPTVNQLMALEKNAQASFLSLHHKWRK